MDAVMWLRSKQVLVGVLVLALVAQMPHAQRVFYSMGHDANWFGWIQSWAAALALEVAVLVFVVRSNVRVSWAFAAFSIAINLMYYYDGVTPYIAPLLLAAGLPIAIALYSHEVAHDEGKAVQPIVQEKTQRVQRVQEAVQPSRDEVQAVQEMVQTEYPNRVRQATRWELGEMVHGAEGDAQPDDKPSEYATRIAHAQLLIAQGRTKGEVAQMIGVHRNTLARLLNTVSAA